MTDDGGLAILHRYLRQGREAVVWKLDGLAEAQVHRPMTSTGTNLLGMVKHLAGVEAGYFGVTFGRPFPEPMPWIDDADAEPNADMWATADESRDEVVGLYRRVWARADETIDALDADARGRVPWWPDERAELTLRQVLTHVIAETHRHAGHADIVRELIDGAAGLRPENSNLADGDQTWWREYRARLAEAATRFD